MARSLYGRLTRRYRPQPTVLDRREFLKITLAASAGLLLSGGDGFMRSESIRDVGRERKVIVIGAGFGGLACAFSGGPPAERARQRWAREKDAAYVEALTEIYPTFRENFVRGRFMDWPSEMWTGAGYSFPAPKQVTRVGPILHGGLGRLHFAGEHACYRFVGYMEGALNSGVAVAKRIAERDAGARVLTG